MSIYTSKMSGYYHKKLTRGRGEGEGIFAGGRGPSNSPWIEFVKTHHVKGQPLDLKGLAAMYHAQGSGILGGWAKGSKRPTGYSKTKYHTVEAEFKKWWGENIGARRRGPNNMTGPETWRAMTPQERFEWTASSPLPVFSEGVRTRKAKRPVRKYIPVADLTPEQRAARRRRANAYRANRKVEHVVDQLIG
jgi:hypothetical protein